MNHEDIVGYHVGEESYEDINPAKSTRSAVLGADFAAKKQPKCPPSTRKFEPQT